MPESTVFESAKGPAGRRNLFGVIGVVVAFLALGLAALPPWIMRINQPPPKPLADEIADAGAKLVQKLKEKIKGPPPPPPPPKQVSWPVAFTIAATSLGLLAVVLGSVSWIKREDHRISFVSLAVGLVAVAWQYIVAALVIGVIVLFVLSFLKA